MDLAGILKSYNDLAILLKATLYVCSVNLDKIKS